MPALRPAETGAVAPDWPVSGAGRGSTPPTEGPDGRARYLARDVWDLGPARRPAPSNGTRLLAHRESACSSRRGPGPVVGAAGDDRPPVWAAPAGPACPGSRRRQRRMADLRARRARHLRAQHPSRRPCSIEAEGPVAHGHSLDRGYGRRVAAAFQRVRALGTTNSRDRAPPRAHRVRHLKLSRVRAGYWAGESAIPRRRT